MTSARNFASIERLLFLFKPERANEQNKYNKNPQNKSEIK